LKGLKSLQVKELHYLFYCLIPKHVPTGHIHRVEEIESRKYIGIS